MPRMGSNRVGLSPDISERLTVTLRSSFDRKTKMDAKSKSHKQATRRITASPGRLFRYVKTNVAKAIRLVTKKRPVTATRDSSDTLLVAPPERFIPHRDSHQSENLEDCIEFINSSYRKSI